MLFKRIYLEPKVVWSFFWIVLIFGYFDFLWGLSLLVLFSGFTALYFRKSNPLNTQKTMTDRILFSPVSGTIEKIYHDIDDEELGEKLTQIEIIIPPFKEMSIRMPSDLEVASLFKRTPLNKFRFELPFIHKKNDPAISGRFISFASPYSENISLRILRCWFSGYPRIWVSPGDRAKAGTPFGFLPFGGRVALFLPKNNEVFVKEGDEVKAAYTPLAGAQKTDSPTN